MIKLGTVGIIVGMCIQSASAMDLSRGDSKVGSETPKAASKSASTPINGIWNVVSVVRTGEKSDSKNNNIIVDRFKEVFISPQQVEEDEDPTIKKKIEKTIKVHNTFSGLLANNLKLRFTGVDVSAFQMAIPGYTCGLSVPMKATVEPAAENTTRMTAGSSTAGSSDVAPLKGTFTLVPAPTDETGEFFETLGTQCDSVGTIFAPLLSTHFGLAAGNDSFAQARRLLGRWLGSDSNKSGLQVFKTLKEDFWNIFLDQPNTNGQAISIVGTYELQGDRLTLQATFTSHKNIAGVPFVMQLTK